MRLVPRFLLLALALFTMMALKAQTARRLEGSGNVITKNFPVTAFSSLEAEGLYELHLSQGGSPSVRVEADDNLMDLLAVLNEGNRLIIDMKKAKETNINTKKGIKVYVTFTALESMKLRTIGGVRSDAPLTFTRLTLDNHSVGDVQLELTAERLQLNNASVGSFSLKGSASEASVVNGGVGELAAGNFVVQVMSIENSGVGNAEVNATRELKVKDNWLSPVKNKGGGRKIQSVKL